jgi:hypothetical protein
MNMSRKRAWLGSMVTAVIFGAVIAANSFIFPAVLATTPEKSEVKSISGTGLSALTAQTAAQNMNIISEEKAIELAAKAVKDGPFPAYTSALPHKTRLVNSTSPLKAATWSVAFYKETGTTRTIYSVTVDAMTGEASGPGMSEGPPPDENAFSWSGSFHEKQNGDVKVFICEIFDGDGLLAGSFEMTEEEMKDPALHSKYFKYFTERWKKQNGFDYDADYVLDED